MKRFIAAVSFAVLAGGAAFAAEPSGPIAQSPLDVPDPLMGPTPNGAPLPPLPPGPGGSPMFRDMQPRPLPGQRTPVFTAPPPS